MMYYSFFFDFRADVSVPLRSFDLERLWLGDRVEVESGGMRGSRGIGMGMGVVVVLDGIGGGSGRSESGERCGGASSGGGPGKGRG